MPARNILTLFPDIVNTSGELLTMSRDIAVNYKDNVVDARNIFERYRAVIDHSKDIVAMSGNKCILSLFKTNNYSNLLVLYSDKGVNYIAGGAMYMYKMEGSPV